MFALGQRPGQRGRPQPAVGRTPRSCRASVTTIRTAKNVTNKTQTYRVDDDVAGRLPPSRSRRPSFTVAPGKTATINITIKSSAPTAQYFGEVRLKPLSSSVPTLHLPVAFIPQQGDIKVTQACARRR